MSKRRQVIAKEIVDQVHINFMRQATDNKQANKELTEKSVKSYKPGENFYGVFSKIIGHEDSNIPIEEKKKRDPPTIGKPSKKIVTEEKIEPEHKTPRFEEKPLPSFKEIKQPRNTSVPEQKRECPRAPAQPSVFEKLSQIKKESKTNDKKDELDPQVKQQPEQPKEEPTKSKVSVFEKLSRKSNTG